MNAFFYVAISHIPLGTAVTIEFIGPLVLSAVLSHSIRDVLWVGLAMVGVGLFGVERLFGLSSMRPVGVVCALGAGLFWALYILAADNAGKKGDGNWSYCHSTFDWIPAFNSTWHGKLIHGSY